MTMTYRVMGSGTKQSRSCSQRWDGSDHDRILTPADASPGRRPQPPTRSKVRNRCISPAARHSGDCLLSEPIAGTLSLAAGTRLHAPKPALPDASYEASDLFSFVTLRGSVRRRGGIVETFPSCFPPLWYVFAVAAPGSTECRGRIVGLPKASLSCGHANSLLSGQTLRSLADGNINHPKVAFPIAVLREVPAQ